MTEGERGGSGAIVDEGLVENVGQVVGDRALADHQRLGDLAVGEALGNQPQHFSLAQAEPGGQVRPGSHSSELAHPLAHLTR